MKDRKIKITDFQIKSFVTSIEKTEEETVKGGGILSLGRHCTHIHHNLNCLTRNTEALFCGSGTH